MGKALLTASAVFLIVLGVAFNLAPGETLRLAGIVGFDPTPWQMLAGGLLGVGVLNWWSRERPFGGIYGRPLGVANVLLIGVGAFALWRAASPGSSSVVWGLFFVYAAFAAAFVWIVFLHDHFLPKGEAE